MTAPPPRLVLPARLPPRLRAGRGGWVVIGVVVFFELLRSRRRRAWTSFHVAGGRM